MENIIKFEVGQTYSTPSICDSEMMVTATIVKRTAKRVTFTMKGENKTETKGITIYDGKEVFYPWGQYSMCPSLRADDLVVLKDPSQPANETIISEDVSKVILSSTGETLEDLFREGAGLFTAEQMNAIKLGLAEVLMDEAFKPERPMAKIYNMADYRR